MIMHLHRWISPCLYMLTVALSLVGTEIALAGLAQPRSEAGQAQLLETHKAVSQNFEVRKPGIPPLPSNHSRPLRLMGLYQFPAPGLLPPWDFFPSLPDRQDPVPGELDPDQSSLQNRLDYARRITVEISAEDIWGSGILIQQQGSRYWVLSNDHVLRSTQEFTLKTQDGQLHQGQRYPWPALEDYDLGLVVFEANQPYTIATFAPVHSLQEGDLVYVAGFPVEPSAQQRQSFELEEGRVVLIAERPLEWGYQVGYSNSTVKGMSGGPVLNRDNQVVAIHGLGAFPLWGDPYVYQDGSSPPCEPLWEVMYRLNWGIPVASIAQALPSSLKLSQGSIPEVPAHLSEKAGGDRKRANDLSQRSPWVWNNLVLETKTSPALDAKPPQSSTSDSPVSQGSVSPRSVARGIPTPSPTVESEELFYEDFKVRQWVTLSKACYPNTLELDPDVGL